MVHGSLTLFIKENYSFVYCYQRTASVGVKYNKTLKALLLKAEVYCIAP